MMTDTVSIVIPSNRPDRIVPFLERWAHEFKGHDVIVVEDGPVRTFKLPPWVRHHAWDSIDRVMGKHSWMIPRRTDCVRSFGFLVARGDLILTLDDDCMPSQDGERGDWIAQHSLYLSIPHDVESWVDTGSLATRGVPEQRAVKRMCAISHGLWDGVPDLDARQQILYGPNVRFAPTEQFIPRGTFFPMCGMNLGFHREMLPAMYFLLMGGVWPYDRFGDIWCGLFAKAICDQMGWAVHSGAPYVIHARASNARLNLYKEAPGYDANETLWQAVDTIRFNPGLSVADHYSRIAQQISLLPWKPQRYWTKLARAMRLWVTNAKRAPLVVPGEVLP